MQHEHTEQTLAAELEGVPTLSRAERLGKLRAAIADTYVGILAERAINYTNTDDFNKLMAQKPAWGEHIPVTVKSWEGPRYRK